MVGLRPGSSPNDEMIQLASSLVDCLIISSDACSEDESRKRARSDDGDEDRQQRVAVDFERFEDDDIVVDADRIQTINEYQKTLGEPYVDPQFPPTDRSLYPCIEDGQTLLYLGPAHPVVSGALYHLFLTHQARRKRRFFFS